MVRAFCTGKSGRQEDDLAGHVLVDGGDFCVEAVAVDKEESLVGVVGIVVQPVLC